MPTESETGQAHIPATNAPKHGKGAAAKRQPRVVGDGRGRGVQPARTGDALKKELREFAAARPDGWNHEDWISFLEELRARGHNIEDRETIGRMLERERLGVLLEKVKGMGPQRVEKLAERFGQLWQLRQASVQEVADAANLPRSLAERVKAAVGG